MNIFLIKGVKFSIILAGMIGFLAMLNALVLRSEAFQFADTTNVLILGDSNTQYGINDSLLSNTVNLSHYSDAYFYNYIKLTQAIQFTPSIDTVLLGFSPHDIFAEKEEMWLLDDSHMKERFGNYYPFMNWSEIEVLYHNSELVNMITSVVTCSFVNIFDYLIGESLNSAFGGYKYSTRDKLDEALEKLNPNAKRHDQFELAHIELIYLQKIIQVCQKEDISLFFINTPKRPELLKTDSYGNEVFYKVYANRYREIPLLDFSKYKLPDSAYSDLMHLNHKGAEMFSKHIRNKSTVFRF